MSVPGYKEMYEQLLVEIGEINFISAVNRLRDLLPKAYAYPEALIESEHAKEAMEHYQAENSTLHTRIGSLLDVLAEQQRELKKLRAEK